MAVATIIIPSSEKHVPLLKRAVQSAYAQTVPVNVDYLIDSSRGTPAYGRNIMAKRAATEFVVMLDADDYLLPNAVEEMLKAWRPGSYVYSDWFQYPRKYIRAHQCYGFKVKEGRAPFHLPPTLFPTAFWSRIGGQDEKLFGAEDTEFFFKANARMIHSIHVEQPLLFYTPDGARAQTAASDPRWLSLIKEVYRRHRRSMNMSCCGAPSQKSHLAMGTQLEGDILVRPTGQAMQKYRGHTSGRKYGKYTNRDTFWIDPEDFNPTIYEQVEDWEALSPTDKQIEDAMKIDPNDPVAVLRSSIVKAGVRASFHPVEEYGFDMQQNPLELAQFLHQMTEKGVKQVLEIGTGKNAGLARFLVEELGWAVVSIDIEEPAYQIEGGGWEFIHGSSQDEEVLKQMKDRDFDLVFIDGAHDYDSAKADWKHYQDLAPIIALHDISKEGYFPDGVAKLWEELAYTPKTKELRSGYHEIQVDKSGLGIGWYERGE
jgi:hypothetical protein